MDQDSWSNMSKVDPSAEGVTGPDPGRPRARADAFSRAVGAVDLEELRHHHLALAMAVIEFAADGERPLPWSHDDPTVALLRAAAKLSLTAPDATSAAAADLIASLQATT